MEVKVSLPKNWKTEIKNIEMGFEIPNRYNMIWPAFRKIVNLIILEGHKILENKVVNKGEVLLTIGGSMFSIEVFRDRIKARSILLNSEKELELFVDLLKAFEKVSEEEAMDSDII